MAKSIDERIVAMGFENATFEKAVDQTLKTMAKLDAALANIGKTSGLKNIEVEASKITLAAPMSVVEKFKSKFSFGEAKTGFDKIESDAERVKLFGPNRALEALKAKFEFRDAKGSFDKLEADSGRVRFQGLFKAIDAVKRQLTFDNAGKVFRGLERAANAVTFGGLQRTISKVQGWFQFPDAKKSFAEIERASNQVKFEGLNKAAETAANQFTMLQGVATVAIGNIAAVIAQKAAQMIGDLGGVKAIADGFADYELKIGATQTIMSGTGEDMKTVSKYLKDLDTYADRTIYNLRDMTGNIGKFTNAGVKLPVAVDAMKGIANLAALSGANAEEASRSMYNLGQAIGSGKVRMADWRSVELANMATKEFKDELIGAALATGDLKKGSDGVIRSTKGNEVNFKTFNSTLEDNWLTSEALTKTLSKYSDETTNLGKKAYAAASDVKTFSMLLETLAAAAGTGWTDTFEIIFGNLPEATKLWTGISKAVGGFLGKTADARNEMLKVWKTLGGREDLLEGLKNFFLGIGSIIKPIAEAFRNIFPKTTGKQLADLSEKFKNLMDRFRLGPEASDKLRRIFEGLFAAIDIGVEIVKEIVRLFGRFFGAVADGSGGFTNFLAAVGDFAVALHDALIEGGALKTWFENFADILAIPMKILVAIAAAIASLFDGTDQKASGAFMESLGDLGKKMGPIQKTVDLFSEGWGKLVEVFNNLKTAVEPGLSKVFEQIDAFSDMVAESFENANWDRVFEVLETTFIGGIFIAIKKALANGLGINIGGDVLDSVSETMKALTSNLVTMQQNVRANTLLQIAGAVALLAVGIKKISEIDAAALSKAMIAIAVGLGELVASVFLLAFVGGGWKAVIGLGPLAGVMIALAFAIVILAKAVEIMGRQDLDDLGKGLLGIFGVLRAVSAGSKGLGRGLALAGIGMMPMALGLMMMAVAVKMMGNMDWKTLAKGLIGIVFVLDALSLGLSLMGPIALTAGPSLIMVAFGLSVMAGAISALGHMDLKTLVKGIVAMGLALVVIAGAMWLFPPYMIATAAGLILVGIGLSGIAGAIGILGNLNLKTLAKGIGAIGVVLLILAETLTLMIGTLPGAAALVVAAIALGMMVPVITALGHMDWGTIFKGLLAVALALSTLAVFGLLAAPAMLAIGIALVPMGLGMILVALAAKKMAEAFVLLGTTGEAGITAAVAAIGTLIYLLPRLLIDFVKGMIGIFDSLARLLPKIIQSLGLVILGLLDGIIQIAPKLLIALGKIVDAALKFMKDQWPKWVETGIFFILGILTGIEAHMDEVSDKAVSILLKFMKTLDDRMPEIQNSGAKMIITWLKGLQEHIPEVAKAASETMALFLVEVGKHGERMIKAAGEMMGYLVAGIVEFYPKVAETAAKVVINFINGFAIRGPELAHRAVTAAGKFINAMAKELHRLHDIAADAMIDFLNGLADSIRTKGPELRAAGWNVASALLEGIQAGFDSLGGRIVEKLGALIRLLPKRAQKLLGIHSPSRIFADIGKNTILGLIQGMKDTEPEAEEASSDASNTVINTFRKLFGIHSPSTVMREIGEQVGKGFAQGIRGSEDDIRDAFSDLNQKLGDAMRTARETIKSEQERLDDLRAEKKPDWEAIKESEKIIEQNEKILERSLEGRRMLTKQLSDEKGQLIKLANELEDVTKKLETEQEKLKGLIDERNNFATSTAEKYGALPDVDKDTSLADYKVSINERIAAVKKYGETLQKLRLMGLDDTTYKMLIEEGTEGQDFADQLLKGGQSAVDSINILDTSLQAEAAKLAQNTADNLFNAGIAAAQGLVDGLIAKKADLEKVAGELADAIVKAMKAKLKMKSPSKVFEEIGIFSGDGLAKGLNGSTKLVSVAAANLGNEAMTALQTTMAGISEAIDGNVDMNPTITPVLDLTQITKDAQKLNDLSNVVPITAAASYQQAAAISVEKDTADQLAAEAAPSNSFNYEQNIYSPDPISDIEIYRQTNNQLGKLSRFFQMSAPR